MGATPDQDTVISVSIGEEFNQRGSNLPTGDILTLSGRLHRHSGYLPVLDGHPGSVLMKLDWKGFIRELAVLPYFSSDAIRSCAVR
jgi:hypothetical protein